MLRRPPRSTRTYTLVPDTPRFRSPVSAIAAWVLDAYVVAFAQRQWPATLAEPMTRRFDLADAEMGALIGYGFGFFYALFAIPAGWLVDSTHRMRLLAIGLALADRKSTRLNSSH